ncbi:hypothetical protein K440DRAFT_642021 [Wilcoxina mikolae CBS 423.85]|nr:hypothetical protein K440DRAFT_642021 [Wilcoxina mikolae CBS 423.85]
MGFPLPGFVCAAHLRGYGGVGESVGDGGGDGGGDGAGDRSSAPSCQDRVKCSMTSRISCADCFTQSRGTGVRDDCAYGGDGGGYNAGDVGDTGDAGDACDGAGGDGGGGSNQASYPTARMSKNKPILIIDADEAALEIIGGASAEEESMQTGEIMGVVGTVAKESAAALDIVKEVTEVEASDAMRIDGVGKPGGAGELVSADGPVEATGDMGAMCTEEVVVAGDGVDAEGVMEGL